MGETTAIAWTEATYNPWQGCTKVSPGCAHCYMYRDKIKYGQDPTRVVRSSDATFYKPLHWKEGRMIFTCSWSDFFHVDADLWRDEAWDIIRRTPQHTYQILTKRPERILECLPADWGARGYPNVWLGTSVENQHFADIRIPLLLRVPAIVRFLSCEPLLGPIDLLKWVKFLPWAKAGGPNECEHGYAAGVPCPNCLGRIHWVIVGGESGLGYRPMEVDWARAIRDLCVKEGISFFYKQGCGVRPGMNPTLDGVVWHQYPQVEALA